MSIKLILDELNLENGSNYKKSVIKKHKDNELFKRVLCLALDGIKYTYGITMRNVDYKPEASISLNSSYTLNNALDDLEDLFVSRVATGTNAINKLTDMLEQISADDAYVIERIISRDLKIRLGKTEINKVIPGLITKNPYMRCDIGTEKNVQKNMNFKKKVFSQKKMDGTYRATVADGENSTIMSRPGIASSFPLHEKEIQILEVDGYALLGEMTLIGEQERSKGNGLINSDTPPHEDIMYTLWDMVPLHEYRMTKDELKAHQKTGNATKYEDRLAMLEKAFEGKDVKNLEVIEYIVVTSMKEAFEHFQILTKQGWEGTIIKSGEMVWKDGTSKQQLKVKLVIELDMRITGFTTGTGKNEAYFGAMEFENDEGTIIGRVGVSSMTEKMRDWIHENRALVKGQVMSMECNDITQARGNDYYALSHPRYTELRGKEKITDTLERALEQKQMAMERHD